jgi:hypothetical protein
MSPRDYPLTIPGFRLLDEQVSPPEGMYWEFQTTPEFSVESARRFFIELPEDRDVAFIDVWKRHESWFFVRRDGERLFVKRGHGEPPWNVENMEKVVEWFMASPFVTKPVGSFASFTVTPIPDYLRGVHLNETPV